MMASRSLLQKKSGGPVIADAFEKAVNGSFVRPGQGRAPVYPHERSTACALSSGAARGRAPYDAVTIVASAGGIEALLRILERLPSNFPIPIFIVQHRKARATDVLSQVLSRRTGLHVKVAARGEVPAAHTVYLAPPNRHLTVTPGGRVALHDGTTRVRHVLSSGDPLFESAARFFGRRLIAIVLSGMDRNGAAGVIAVKEHGGFVIAQDRATSKYFAMPEAAIETGCVDEVLSVDEIGPRLVKLVREPAPFG